MLYSPKTIKNKDVGNTNSLIHGTYNHVAVRNITPYLNDPLPNWRTHISLFSFFNSLFAELYICTFTIIFYASIVTFTQLKKIIFGLQYSQSNLVSPVRSNMAIISIFWWQWSLASNLLTLRVITSFTGSTSSSDCSCWLVMYHVEVKAWNFSQSQRP